MASVGHRPPYQANRHDMTCVSVGFCRLCSLSIFITHLESRYSFYCSTEDIIQRLRHFNTLGVGGRAFPVTVVRVSNCWPTDVTQSISLSVFLAQLQTERFILSQSTRGHLSTPNLMIFTRPWLRYVRVFAIAILFFVVCLSSVVTRLCNVRASHSAGRNFAQCFYGILYSSHPLTSV